MAETITPNREYIFHDPLYSVGPLSLRISRIVTTFVVGVAVLMIWRRPGWDIYDLLPKLVSAFLLVDVLVTPSFIPWREKRTGKKVESSVYAENGYRWLMVMATLIFFSR